MAIVTIHQAKTQLSKLIAKAEAGEEVLIMRGKNPVARLTAGGGTTIPETESEPGVSMPMFETGVRWPLDGPG